MAGTVLVRDAPMVFHIRLRNTGDGENNDFLSPLAQAKRVLALTGVCNANMRQIGCNAPQMASGGTGKLAIEQIGKRRYSSCV